MTSSSSTGGMGSAGSMVCRAKLLSLRSRYVISGWSLLRKQQKMKEIPRLLLFLGAMAKTPGVPPSWALDPEGEEKSGGWSGRPAKGRRNQSHPRARHGGEERRRFTCQIFLLGFDVYGPGNLDELRRYICLPCAEASSGREKCHRPCGERSPGPPPLLQIPANSHRPPRAVAARPAPVSVQPGVRQIWQAAARNSWMCLGQPGTWSPARVTQCLKT